MMKITAEVPQNNYLSLEYGVGMEKVDMVIFKAGGEGQIEDLWSETWFIPAIDKSQDYKDTKIVRGDFNTMYKFETYRALDTGDEQDTAIECGKTHIFNWVGSSLTSQLVKHNHKGGFDLTLDSNCNVKTLAEAATFL